MSKEIAQAIENAFISPNVADSNLEPANIVDVLDRLAKAGFAIAEALREVARSPAMGPDVARALERISFRE